jgi:hypothetical protein
LLRPHFFFYFSFCFSQPVALPRPPIWADIRQDFGRIRTSAPSGGYPLTLADIRQGIAGIRDGYPLTISTLYRCSV